MRTVKNAYSTREIANLIHVAQQNIHARAAREQWQSRPRAGRGGGHEWLVSSMPEATRLRIASSVAALAVMEADTLLAASAVPIYKDGVAVPSLPIALGLPMPASIYNDGVGISANSVNTVNSAKPPVRHEVSRQESRLQGRAPARAQSRSQSRAWAVQAAQRFVASGALARSTGYDLFVAQYNTHTIDAPDWIRAALPRISRASLHNWEVALAEQGSCANRQGQARIGTGIIETSPGMAALIKAQIIKTRGITGEEIMQSLECEYTGQALPSVRTVQRFLRDYRDTNALALLKIHNPDRFKSLHQAAAGSRSEDVTLINERWEMDSSPADIILSDGIRYTLLGCVDIYTRRGKLQLEKTSNSHGVCALLRRSILHFGVPHELKIDNGKDYTSIQVTTALNDLHIAPLYCTPFSPEQKPHIERFFGTFQRGLKRLPGFAGHNVAERQAIRSEKSFAERMSRKTGKKLEIEVPMHFEEFQAYCDHYCDNVYGEKVHSALKQSPNDAAAQAQGTVRRVENERALDMLLLQLAGTRVVRKGVIKVHGAAYKAPELGLYEGQEVTLRKDDDAGTLHVFTLDGAYICRAQDPLMTGVSNRDLALATTAVQKAAVGEAVKEAKAIVKAVKPQRLVQAIRAHQEAKAAQARAQREAEYAPLPEYAHTTPALDQAALAALASQPIARVPMRDDEAAMYEKMSEDWYIHNIPKVEVGPEDLATKEAFVTYQMIIDKQNAGLPISKEQIKWFMGYQTTSYCAVHIEMLKDFGSVWLEGVMPYAI